jgi:tetratricopeptide (TPR) repeat protein
VGTVGSVLYDNGITVIQAGQVPEQCRGLVISFSSFGENDPNQAGFGQRFLEKHGYAVAAVKKRIDNWYRDIAPEELADVISRHYAEFETCFTYGASMGGYAALYFAGSIRATAIAISPRNSVDGRFSVGSYAAYVKNWPTPHQPLGLVADPASAPHIVYDPLVKSDAEYIRREVMPAFPNANYVRFPFSGHPSAQAMSELGQLKTFVLDALSGGAACSRIVSARSKKRSTIIVNEMSKWALQRNRLQLGIRLSEMACNLGGERVDLLYQRGSLLIAAGATEEALAVTVKAIDLTGGTSTLFHRLATLLFKLERREGALEAANSGLNLFPGNLGLLRTRRNLYEKNGDSDLALEDALAVVEAAPDNAADRMQLSALLIAKKAYSEAIEHLDAVLVQKDDVLAMRRRRNCLEALGRIWDALDVANDIVGNAPGSISDLMHLADLHSQLGNFERAVATLDRVVELAPDNALVFRRKRNYLEQAGKIGEAIEAAVRVTKLLPDNKLDALRLRRLKLRQMRSLAKVGAFKLYDVVGQRTARTQTLIANSEPFALFPTLMTSVLNMLATDEAIIATSSALGLNVAGF